MTADGICRDGVVGMLEAGQEKTEVMPILHVGLGDHTLDVGVDGGVIYREDPTGQILDPKLVGVDRQKELEFIRVQTCVVADGF